jgi:membrane-bound lytic murein transglycosylase A
MAVCNKRLAAALFSALLLSSCAEIDGFFGSKEETKTAAIVHPDITPVTFAALPEWKNDARVNVALMAFAKSCTRINKSTADKPFFRDSWAGNFAEWQKACAQMPTNADASSARAYFENNFTPYQVTAEGKSDGLFTGYFEASLKGSRTKQGAYQIPLRARPDDLIMVDLGQFRDELKGQRIAGRAVNGNLKPYETRAEIEDGKLPSAQDKPILYVDNAADAFFLQIQGSGIVSLDDGTTMRVGYDGQNGHPYYAIGKELVKRGALTKDNVSMQSIKSWLAAHPDEGREVMRTNKSYVFFKETADGPKGGEGVTLTPERSLAVDHSLIPYGVPVYLQTDNPAASRLMVAQDTGGAIRGAIRGDIFYGYGARAEAMAGPMQSNGRYWFLLPNGITPPGRK